MDELTVYAPMGMLGYGFPEGSLRAVERREPDVFAVDAGSTDPGPYYLGSGKSFTARDMVRRDLGLLLPAARHLGVPFIIGTAGGAGADPHLDWCLDILREVAAEHRLHFRLAAIRSELSKDYVKRKLAEGRILQYEAPRQLTEEVIDRSTHIVAQMGVEPIIKALEAGAEVVVAGRAFDAGLMAALPIMRGFDRGLAFHLGKILECGSLVALPRESDGAIGVIRRDHFLVDPADPAKHCPVDFVTAHTLYEKADPSRLHVPGGILDLTGTQFTQHDPRTVRVAGSRFIPTLPLALKLEGAELAGYRTICISGTRDPLMIEHVEEVLEAVRRKIRRDLGATAPETDYQLLFHVYGRNGVMGRLEPQKAITSHELGFVIEVVARTQALADTVCALARSATLHQGYEGRMATAGNLAFLYSPAEFKAPEVYEFSVYHLMQVDDLSEPFPISLEQV